MDSQEEEALPTVVDRILDRVVWAEMLSGVRHDVLLMTGDELRQVETWLWHTLDCAPRHVKRFVGRRIEVEA